VGDSWHVGIIKGDVDEDGNPQDDGAKDDESTSLDDHIPCAVHGRVDRFLGGAL